MEATWCIWLWDQCEISTIYHRHHSFSIKQGKQKDYLTTYSYYQRLHNYILIHTCCSTICMAQLCRNRIREFVRNVDFFQTTFSIQ